MILKFETYADSFMDALTYLNNRMEKYSLLQVLGTKVSCSESWNATGWKAGLQQKHKPHKQEGELRRMNSSESQLPKVLSRGMHSRLTMHNSHGTAEDRRIWGPALWISHAWEIFVSWPLTSQSRAHPYQWSRNPRVQTSFLTLTHGVVGDKALALRHRKWEKNLHT